jgi:hypothetical protein
MPVLGARLWLGAAVALVNILQAVAGPYPPGAYCVPRLTDNTCPAYVLSACGAPLARVLYPSRHRERCTVEANFTGTCLRCVRGCVRACAPTVLAWRPQRILRWHTVSSHSALRRSSVVCYPAPPASAGGLTPRTTTVRMCSAAGSRPLVDGRAPTITSAARAAAAVTPARGARARTVSTATAAAAQLASTAAAFTRTTK